ncbi:Large proline-rich protein bag6 [Melia azedarach]|nr:Large proline-rich protein bag6 [Melia azedarach]
MPDSTQQPPEQGGARVQSNRPQSAFGIPTAISLGTLPPPVIPDSVTTLNLYLNQLRRDIDANVRGVGNNAQAAATDSTEDTDSNSALHSGTVREGLPTPASLAEVLQSTRQFLIDHTAESLQMLAGHLQNQTNVDDASVRMSSQSSAWRTGLLMHNLGAYMLELGRTIMTLRFGQTPSETVINAGPAVFISPSGPNPLMVQPLPSFGAIPLGPVPPPPPPGSGLANGRGPGLHPRRIDIQIRRGANANQEERGNTQQTSGQGNSTTASGTANLGSQTTARNPEGSSVAGESGVRVLPIRTMVAAMPSPFSRVPSDSSGNPVGVYYPVLGRFQHVATGHVSGERGHQPSSEHRPAAVQTEQPSVPGSVRQQNIENTPRNGSLPNSNSRRRDPSRPRSVNVSILSARGTLNGQDSERQIRSGVFQLLRNLFPAGEIHVDDASLQRTGFWFCPRARSCACHRTNGWHLLRGPRQHLLQSPLAAPVTEQAAGTCHRTSSGTCRRTDGITCCR